MYKYLQIIYKVQKILIFRTGVPSLKVFLQKFFIYLQIFTNIYKIW